MSGWAGLVRLGPVVWVVVCGPVVDLALHPVVVLHPVMVWYDIVVLVGNGWWRGSGRMAVVVVYRDVGWARARDIRSVAIRRAWIRLLAVHIHGTRSSMWTSWVRTEHWQVVIVNCVGGDRNIGRTWPWAAPARGRTIVSARTRSTGIAVG